MEMKKIFFVFLTLVAISCRSQTPSIPYHVTKNINNNPSPLLPESLNISLPRGATVQTETVGEPGAKWIIVNFGDYFLGEKSSLRLISEADGDTQTFNQQSLKEWEGQSAAFRGDQVTIVLINGANDDSFYEIESLIVGEGVQETGIDESNGPALREDVNSVELLSLCGGVDERVPYTDNRVGRLWENGCTAWNISGNLHITAGHCVNSDMMSFHANVPGSEPNGTPVPSATADQFKIIRGSISKHNNGEGDDWAVFRTVKNTLSQTAHEKYGYFTIDLYDVTDGPVSVAGYGMDRIPAGPPPRRLNASNQTLQVDDGELVSITGTLIKHRVDTTGNVSGGPIFLTTTGEAIGIHTNGGCLRPGGSNKGTAFRGNTDLLDAIINPK